MIPLVDMHCHLFAGLDDGPRTRADALKICRIAYEDGIRTVAATAHQNEQYAEITPNRIRESLRTLAQDLKEANIALTVVPCAEVMVHADIETCWSKGELLSVADRGEYLLIELPRGVFVDLLGVIEGLQQAGVRPILAHPERVPELLHDKGRIEHWIEAGCLVQVNASTVTAPSRRLEAKALKDWFQRGIVHVLGSDGHSPRSRQPRMSAAYRQIAAWAGEYVADRVCSINATTILHGLPLRTTAPQRRRGRWFACLW